MNNVSLQFGVTLNVQRIDEGPGTPSIEAEVDNVMDELVVLAGTDCGVSNPAISLDLADEDHGRVTFEVEVVGADFDSAIETAMSTIRAAIHAAGGFTPGWTVAKMSQHAELVDA